MQNRVKYAFRKAAINSLHVEEASISVGDQLQWDTPFTVLTSYIAKPSFQNEICSIIHSDNLIN